MKKSKCPKCNGVGHGNINDYWECGKCRGTGVFPYVPKCKANEAPHWSLSNYCVFDSNCDGRDTSHKCYRRERKKVKR